MITFYTSVGIFETQKSVSGIKRPVIIRSGRKYDVTLPEFVLWSALFWNIHHYDEIKTIYKDRISETGVKDVPSFESVLDRLICGLVESGTGYTGVEALYELLSKMFPIPIRTSLSERIKGFLYLTFIQGMSVKNTGKLFGKPSLTTQEQAVWNLISQRPISVAELIRCIELEVADVSTGSKIVNARYNAGDGVDYKNVDVHARFSDKRSIVIDAVANLYLKKQVLFETRE